MAMRFVSAISLLLALGMALPAAAQFTGTEQLTVSISPDYPRPYQVISITPASTLIDLSSSVVTISVNGEVVEKGSGAITAQVPVGAAGQTTSIVVTAVNNGQTYAARLAVRPADVALIVEPVSTTHPFYKGGALTAAEGRVRLIALPDFRNAAGASINPATLVYTWRLGEQILESSSGIGKSVLSAIAPVKYRAADVSVTVATQDSSIVGQASANISPVDPVVRIYANDPLLGPLFGSALGNAVTLLGSEETFRAVPYYFPSTPTIAWTMNGSPSETGGDITVRSSGSGSGTALLSALARVEGVAQQASAALSVKFGSASTGGFFGI